MPFDDRSFPSVEAAAMRRRRQRVALWLFVVAGMIAVMVVLGGATRLTGSGLSIMEWAPLSGALPPLSGAEWERLFALYRTIPQYALLHPHMSLAGFRSIFWLEWAHRAWGRLIGVAFLVPLVWFAATGAIAGRMVPRLALIFVLGGLQGAVGWFMVASGFAADATSVAPVRLALHLTLALGLFAAVLWTGLSMQVPVATSMRGAAWVRRLATAATGLLGLTIVAGGLVAGLHAGLVDDTFPLMGGRLVPAGYTALHPVWRNLVANAEAVQFDHRVLATLTALAVLGAVAAGVLARAALTMTAAMALATVGALAGTQYCLGVTTLITGVAAPLAIAHQVTAVGLLAACLVLTHSVRGAR